MTPLFDSLAHPTLTGHWLDSGHAAGFSDLVRAADGAGFARVCAVGIDGIEGYEHEAFFRACAAHEILFPVAGFNPRRADPRTELSRIHSIGYTAIKIHPRFSGTTRAPELLMEAFASAGELGLTVFYCTYQHCALDTYPERDPLYYLVEILRQAPDTKVILLHGGDVSLLTYAELVRFNHNLLLDLSLTLMKYQGSSIDADIRFLASHFDRRICIGSDHPEYSHQSTRERFEYFTARLPSEKVSNIAFNNLDNFLSP